MLKLFKIILSPAAFIYSIIVKARNLLFDKNIFKTQKVDAKVISIGNLTVGGSGKTPAAIYLTNAFKNKGVNAGVLSRGYKRKSKGYLLVSDGENILSNINECGDEIYLVSEECKVPTAVSEWRVEGAKRFLTDTGVEAIILDDAYQHRWIHRDLNILIFDQRFLDSTSGMDQKLLPVGRMREPFASIDRADVIVINRKFSGHKEIPIKLKKYFDNTKIFTAHYEAKGFYDVKSHKFYERQEFQGQRSLVICGIARPDSFYKILQKDGIDITNKISFPDHKEYNLKEIQLIRKKFYETNAYSVLTTQKDAVKLKHFSKELDDIDIFYLKIEFKIDQDELFNQILDKSIKA